MEQILDELSFRAVVPHLCRSTEAKKILEGAFCFWHENLASTLGKIIKGHTLWGDDFLLQDKLFFISFDDQIIGSLAISEYNTKLKSDMSRSYWDNYPKASREYICHNFDKIFVMSNLIIAPQFRKSISAIPFSSYLLSLGVINFIESDSSDLVVITRNERGTHKLMRSFGAKSIFQTQVYNQKSEIMVLNKSDALKSIKAMPDKLQTKLFNLYKNQQLTRSEYELHV